MLLRCSAEGVNFCVSGEPCWTADTGGFFVDQDPTLALDVKVLSWLKLTRIAPAV